jgi:hypothetical protein
MKRGQRPPKSVVLLMSDTAWLVKRYVDERKGAHKIAAELGVSNVTVLKWLRKAGIQIRCRRAPVAECAFCHNTFKTHPSINAIYCSKECCYNASRKEILCETCEKALSIPASSKQTFCSHLCAAVSRSGDKNFNWKGGVSKDRKAYSRARYIANPALYRQRHAEWRKRNPEKAKESSARHEAKRRSYNAARCKKYRQENPEKTKSYNCTIKQADSRRKYRNKRYLVDKEFRISTRLSHGLYNALKGSGKFTRTWQIVGCTKEFFMEWLQDQFKRGMNWNNHGTGKGKWHIDHKVGIAKFDHTDTNEVKRCWHYSNLRPLWSRQNIRNKHNNGLTQPGLGI